MTMISLHQNLSREEGETWTNMSQDSEQATGPEQPNYWALLVLFLPILTALGNLLVIMSVANQKVLQTSTNFLIVSLAWADLLVAILVMPWGIYVMVFEIWTLPFVLCDVYIAMDVICSTASIFNLVAISIDRYKAVSRPMKYSQEQQSNDHTKVIRTILSIWGVSFLVGLPILLGLNSSSSSNETECKFYDADFIILSSVISFYIPCVIILVLYYRIMKAIVSHDKEKVVVKSKEAKKMRRKRRKRKQKKAPQTKDGQGAPLGTVNSDHDLRSNIERPCDDDMEDEGEEEKPTSKKAFLAKKLKSLKLPKLMTTPVEDDEEEEEEGDIADKASPVNEHKGIASLMSNIIRMSTNPLEKTDLMSAEEPEQQLQAVVSSSDRKTPEPDNNEQNEVGQAAAEDEDPQHVSNSSAEEKMNDHESNNKMGIVLKVENTSFQSHEGSNAQDLGKFFEGSSNNNQNGDPCLLTVPGSPSLKPCKSELELCSNSRLLDTPFCSSLKKIKSCSRQNLTVTFSLGTSNSSSSINHRTSFSLMPGKAPVARSIDSKSTKVANSGGNSGRRSSLGTSIKVLRRAATWKIRSQERLQAKRERRERRATKTLGIVLGCFLFCWIPFFVCNILSAISIKLDSDALMPTMSMFIVTTWLGYMNSALNPLIYTLFNLEFRKAFKKMLCMNSEYLNASKSARI